jgi:hypothetical protein
LQADASWAYAVDNAGHAGFGWVGTSACFIFKLDGAASERFDSKGVDENYQYANPSHWPEFGAGADIYMGGGNGALGVGNAYCTQNTYTAVTNQVCGGSGSWGSTDLVVFGRVAAVPLRCCSTVSNCDCGDYCRTGSCGDCLRSRPNTCISGNSMVCSMSCCGADWCDTHRPGWDTAEIGVACDRSC